MLWDPGSVKKDGEEEEPDSIPVTPILVPLQNKSSSLEKGVPVLVPDMQDLKDQFQHQQNMLTQIKETLKKNESQLSSKEKQVEVYANKLSQIRERSRNTQSKKLDATSSPNSSPKTPSKKSSKENISKIENVEANASDQNIKFNRKGKVSELKKCLEENKIKFEQRTGKEQSETKKIESLVEVLKTQLEERDKIIQGLQKSIDQPNSKSEATSQKTPKHKFEKESVASKAIQTSQVESSENSIEIIALQNKIYELEANILDLEENLKEKESVIEARTQAVTLLSQDLSLKGKSTLESLEETRQEMRTMQNNFIAMEDKLRKDLSEKENRTVTLEEKCKKLESTNFDLSLKNAEIQEKLVKMQEKCLEAEAKIKSFKETTVQAQNDEKIEELSKKINVLTKELDDRNKSMIKMKIEHKKTIANLNTTLETLKGNSNEKAEIVRLSSLVEELEIIKNKLENRVAELEDEKGNLLLSILDVDDFKATEKKLKDQINELEIIIQKQNEDLALHLKAISNLEKENLNFIQTTRDQNLLIEDLNIKIQTMENRKQEESTMQELLEKIEKMEKDHRMKIDELKAEHTKEIEMLEAFYNSKMESVDKRELEEYRISAEINNIHVEEQIELLIREKQQLMEKLKSLSGVSSTDSLTFEKMEHSDLKDDKETIPQVDDLNLNAEENRISHLQRIVNDQQVLVSNLQETIKEEEQKSLNYQQKITELEDFIKNLEDINVTLKQQIEMSEPTESGKNQKSNVNARNRVKKIEMELTQSKKIIQEQKEKLSELNQKLEEKEELIRKYTEKIELFEKDDWDRQNHWKNTEDDIETFQELQKKCLSLENSLIELNEDCERLRKENIEVVHLLSEEKVKRRKVLEQLQAQAKPNLESWVEEKFSLFNETIRELEGKLEKLEAFHSKQSDHEVDKKFSENLPADELQGKLEWANVVLTSKETEIFRLQNLLEDRNKSLEILEGDLSEFKAKFQDKEKKLGELVDELRLKENQLEEISANFDKLQECVDVANQKTAVNESQLKELLATVKEMEEDVFRKESELQEIKGILAEKNLDMTNLRNRLEEVNSDLTYSYQEHLENMNKCLRDKEYEYDTLLLEKNYLENIHRNLITEKEDIYNQKVEVMKEKEKLQNLLAEKDETVKGLTEKLQTLSKLETEKTKSAEIEEMKIKMKKLAANLKKKAQNEADLSKQIKELEEKVLTKDKSMEELKDVVKNITEKWESEKSEKIQAQKELSDALMAKAVLEDERSAMGEKLSQFERESESFKKTQNNRVKELEEKLMQLYETSNNLQAIEKQDKDKIIMLEKKLSELDEQTIKINEEREKSKILIQKLEEITGKYEKIKFDYEQLLLEKESKDLEKTSESTFDPKIEENLAVIEILEGELEKTRDQMKTVEEKFFSSMERRLSLENKNKELCKKIMENSENLAAMNDLSVRIEELLKSEKYLQECVRNLENGNAELKEVAEEVRSEKLRLEMELKISTEKISEISKELKELKNSDDEKCNLIRNLTKEVEKLKTENTQLSSEFEKLNKDYEQFEMDFKDNLESSQNVEKTLKQRIEELTIENSALIEKCNILEEKTSREEDKKPKKRKSVTFRTDEVEYIKDLKNQLHNYDANLKQANQEIENLKAELFREKLREEVSKVVDEAQEKVENLKLSQEIENPQITKFYATSTAAVPEHQQDRKFDASLFFENESSSLFNQPDIKRENFQQSSDFDSLIWDDGWGTDGHLEEEYLAVKNVAVQNADNSEKIKTLECEVKKLQEENQKLIKDLEDQTAKYIKALKKLKEIKVGKDKLELEISKLKNNMDLGALDAAIVDELKSRIDTLEAKEKELMKSLENAKSEQVALVKKVEVLTAENEKLSEKKENQNSETEIWQRKNKELLKEISELRQQLENLNIPDDNLLMQENRELKNKVEALEWKNCELIESLEEKQELLEGRPDVFSSDVEKVMEEKSLLQKEIDELNNVKELLEKKLFDEEKKSSRKIGELNEQLSALATEKENLQDILGEMKKSEIKTEKSNSNIIDYFKSSPDFELVPNKEEYKKEEFDTKTSESEQLLKAQSDEIKTLQEKILEMESLIKSQNEKLQLSSEKERNVMEKLKEFENLSELREEKLIQNANLEKDDLKHKFLELESEKVNEIARLRQRVFELENALTIKNEEFQQERKDLETLKQTVSEVFPNASNKHPPVFETVDLNPSTDVKFENIDFLQEKIVDLERLISVKEEEVQQIRLEKENESYNLRQKIFQLEDLLKEKEEGLNRAIYWNQDAGKEMEDLKQRIINLEEAVRFKENEIYQIQMVKNNEIHNQEQKTLEMENSIKMQMEQQILDLQNLLRFKDEELHRILAEKSNIEQKILEFENLLTTKEQQINELVIKLKELEKSYNDSKLEIERLLNEEKLNTEEKFAEPFQKNIQIPVAFEVEALSRTLNEEKQKSENLLYELSEKKNFLLSKNNEIEILNAKVLELEKSAEEEIRKLQDEKGQLEKIITGLQDELETSSLQLNVVKKELEEFQSVKDEAMSDLKVQLRNLETELLESREKTGFEVAELTEKNKFYEALLKSKSDEETKTKEKINELEKLKSNLEKEVKILKSVLESKEGDISGLAQSLEEEKAQVADLSEALKNREEEVADLKQTLTHLQSEISQFRNFEKQVRDLRAAQLTGGSAETALNQEGHPDLSDWSEHELAELSIRLQSDLDTALYMLHQRDVRCDELTFELMQLLEERDTLQLRLSTALRINEEIRSLNKMENPNSVNNLHESKDLVDQSNDRQEEKTRVPSEDLRKLASKISELHSVSYLKDKTVKDDSVQRHSEQMNLLTRVSESDMSLTRDVQSPPAVLLNWVRGKTTPKVMHI